jgi:hypothetical protein
MIIEIKNDSLGPGDLSVIKEKGEKGKVSIC